MDEVTKSDAQRLREQIAKAVDTNLSLEEREIALDDIEMLVESIDAANDLATIGGVPRLLELLKDPEDSIKIGVAWIFGTCAQSNVRFTKAFIAAAGLDRLLALLRESTDGALVSKLVYAVTSCIRAAPEATEVALKDGAFETLLGVLTQHAGADLPTKRKLVFFLGGVLFEQSSNTALLKHLFDLKLYDILVDTLKQHKEDEDLREKIFETLDAAFNSDPAAVTYITQGTLKNSLQSWVNGAQLSPDERKFVGKTLMRIGIALPSSAHGN